MVPRHKCLHRLAPLCTGQFHPAGAAAAWEATGEVADNQRPTAAFIVGRVYSGRGERKPPGRFSLASCVGSGTIATPQQSATVLDRMCFPWSFNFGPAMIRTSPSRPAVLDSRRDGRLPRASATDFVMTRLLLVGDGVDRGGQPGSPPPC